MSYTLTADKETTDILLNTIHHFTPDHQLLMLNSELDEVREEILNIICAFNKKSDEPFLEEFYLECADVCTVMLQFFLDKGDYQKYFDTSLKNLIEKHYNHFKK